MIIVNICVFFLCLIWLLPIQEIFPSRQMQQTFNTVLSRRQRKSAISASTVIKKLHIWIDLMIKIFHVFEGSKRWQKYPGQLRRANADSILTTEQFVGLKFLVAVVCTLYFSLLAVLKMDILMFILGVAVAFVAFSLPDQWLKIRIKKRRLEIQREMPSVLVSLAVTTDAGLSLLQAMEEISNRKSGAMSDEIGKTLLEISIGIPQREAFQNMANRVLMEEFTLFVSVITQTLEKGSSGMTGVLRELATEAWVRRKSKAKELGEKASIKLFFPLVLFIFPSLMIFLISPALLSIIHFFVS